MKDYGTGNAFGDVDRIPLRADRRCGASPNRACRPQWILARSVPLCLMLLLLLVPWWAAPSTVRAWTVPRILVDRVASHNLRFLETSLEDGSYRGEAGILRVAPKAAEALGLKVHRTPEYLQAEALLEAAKEDLHRARRATETGTRGPVAGDHVQVIADAMLSHREKTQQARALLAAYAACLTLENDERLDRPRCQDIITRILEEVLGQNNHRLRDALGCFANRCRGENASSCVTPENVRFVNAVFRDFVNEAPKDILARFDLDRIEPTRSSHVHPKWKEAAGDMAALVAPLIDHSLSNLNRNGSSAVDPLLFVALIRRESRFDPKAVSHVGAAGLTQIMPRTALEMGMEDVFHPPYFEQAFAVLHKEREARREAMDALFAITPGNGPQMAARARERMQDSIRFGEERKRLFARYRKELQGQPSDPRLQADKAVEYGLRYFSELMRAQDGDISLALASYNAGPHRVRQYQGIPPYGETVRFRNQVLKYYREYLEILSDI